MPRNHEPAQPGNALVSPVAGSIRRLALVFLLGVWAATSLAADTEPPPPQLAYEYQAPQAPGDPFSLRFQVPAGFVSAIIITNLDPEDSGETTSSATDEVLDLRASVVIFVPPADDTGFTGVDGIVPDTVTAEQLQKLAVEVRIVFFNPATLECFVTAPIPLWATPPPEQPPPESSAPATGGSPTTKGLPSGGGGNPAMAMSSSQGNSNNGSTHSKFSVPTNYIGVQFSSHTPLIAVAGAGAFTVSIHDQPTPVQGSGH